MDSPFTRKMPLSSGFDESYRELDISFSIFPIFICLASMWHVLGTNQICFDKLMLIKWIFHRCNGRNPDLKNIAVFSILCYYNFKELEKVWKLLNKPLNSCISSISPLVWKMSTISDQTFAIFFPTKIYADFIFTDTTRF